MRRVAHTALKGLGFGWGQENVSATGEIMGGYSATALRFGNECTALASTNLCFHEGCPTGQQNSTADLMVHLGARVDDGPPVVEITSPTHLSVLPSAFPVEVSVEDLFGGLVVSLELVEAEQVLADAEPPYGWNLTGVPDGMWTLRVSAVDADGNEESDEVVVCVGLDACEPGQTSSASSEPGDESGSGETMTSGDNDGGGIDPTVASSGSAGASPAGSACHCSSNARSPHAIGALVLLALMRKRRAGPLRRRYSSRMKFHSP
jgi:hypothetical protein